MQSGADQSLQYTSSKDIEDVQYAMFLIMARSGNKFTRLRLTDINTHEGIRALEFYDPVAKKHGQAHMQARLGITQWLIKEGIARVEEIRAKNGTLENLYIRVGLFEFECASICPSHRDSSSTGRRS